MPKISTPLSTMKIKKSKPKDKVYRLSDGGGLVLEIKPNGSKIWRVRYSINKRSKMYTIGAYPIVPLQQAREITKEVKNLVLRGIDPVEDRRESFKEVEMTTKRVFKTILEEFFEMKAKELSKVYLKKQKRRAEIYILPKVGNKDINDISKSDIVKIIKDVKNIETPTTKNTDKVATSRKVFNIVRQVYQFALYSDYTDMDPTSKIDISRLLPKTISQNFKAVTDEREIKILYKLITEEYQGYLVISNALNFLALTALRVGNVRNLRWDYVDLEKRVINFPAEVMKTRVNFRLPLTDTLYAILRKMQDITGRISTYVFCSPIAPRKMMSDNTLNIAHKRLGINNHTSHGWRSSFSTICYENQKKHGFSAEVIESQLSHSIGNSITRAYMRSDFLEERRELLKWWEEFLK